jgi:CheY-like chemotaxis protein
MTEPVKFLVVDPLAGVQTFSRQLLQGYGFAADTILCLSDTEAALAQGLSFKPDMLITDWFAKGTITGLALYERLKAVSPGLRVGFLSFEITPEYEAQARAAQAMYLVRKPFTADQLRAALRQALDNLAKESPALHQRMSQTMFAAHAHGDIKRVALPTLPVLPSLKPGDKVRIKGEIHTIQYVVHRAGETAVQVKGKGDLIPESKLERMN